MPAFPRRLVVGLVLGLALGAACTPALRADPEPAGTARDLGVGLRLGTPVGLSVKYWMNRENALDLAVGSYGYAPAGYTSGINVHLDYLWHRFGVFGSPLSQAYNHLPIYVGVGGLFASPDVAGLRTVIGITWLFDRAPFDLFLDVAPTLVVAPTTGFGVDSGVGGRFYF